jgi:2-oxoglutarate ferredoxin oxidoreductase subunit delta
MAHIEVDQARCKSCELCVHACPKKLISIGSRLNQAGYHPAEFDRKHADACMGCTLCGQMCPEVAITVFRESVSQSREKTDASAVNLENP